MATIQEIRQKYPQYADLSDEQLAQGLHKKYYSDLPYEDFAQKVGLEIATQAPEPEQSAVGQLQEFGADLGRNAAIQAGEFVKGASSVVALPTDTLVHLVNLLAGRKVMTPAAESISSAIDTVMPEPQNVTERIAGRVVGSLGGAASGIKAGQTIGGVVGSALATAPARQAAGAVAGGTSAQLAAEAGGGPIAQTVAGLAGGLAASGAGRSTVAEGVKRSFRGGEEGRQRTAENIRTFEDAGTTPTAGQATEARRLQATESLLSRTPGGAGVLARKAEQQAQQLGSNIERLANDLASRASGEQAGRAIQRGVSGEGGFIDQFKAQSRANYDQLDQFVQKNTKFALPDTTKALEELTTPIYGAERTSQFFINSKVSAIKEALTADLTAGGNTLPYEAVKKLRSIVGEQLADAPFAGDVPRSQWKRLYAAMSADLERNAKTVGPEAEKALARANAYHAAGMRRLDTISAVIDRNGGPEKVFQAALSGTKEGATTLRAVMQSLPKDAQRMLSAGVLRRLGRATAGRQDELGEKFSTETFLTNWNSMSPQAKAVLFDRYGQRFRQDMDQVAKVAANLREGSQVFRNPSGTAQATVQTSAAVGFIASLATGHVGTAATIGGGVGAANLSARLLAHPPFVKWLAKTTRVPVEAAPVMLNQLAQSDDSIMREAAQALAENRDQ